MSIISMVYCNRSDSITKYNLIVLYNKNSNGFLKDFEGMKKEKQVCWRYLTGFDAICVHVLNRSRSTTNGNAHRSYTVQLVSQRRW